VATSDQETSLTGGRLTAGVVRVGETVRRPSKPRSPFVAQLLRYLEAVGCDAAPRYLGIDAEGRDTFDFISGAVHPRWQQWTDEQVAAAGRLLRTLHDATAGSALTAGEEVVCHNDAGPNNFVFREGLPVALIDFDFAAPGEGLDDLAYMAWAWCISSKRGEPVESQAWQVRLLADAYGLESDGRTSLVAAILARLEQNICWWSERLADGTVAAAFANEVIEWSRRERAFIDEHSAVFVAALLSQHEQELRPASAQALAIPEL